MSLIGMKALSLRQPWTPTILDRELRAPKRVENRHERSSAFQQLKNYREPFLLHASAGVGSILEFHQACEFISDTLPELDWVYFRDTYLGIRMHADEAVFTPGRELPRGGIVGMARVAGLITPMGDPYGLEGAEAVKRLGIDMGWHMKGFDDVPGQWGIILDDVEPLPFIPCKGALGLWEYRR